MNPRVTRKEHGLIKGALRRVFSRSELREAAIAATRIDYTDTSGKTRTKKWCRCPACKKPTPEWKMEVDHLDPVIPTDKTLYDLDANALVDRIWCERNNLIAICKPCHTEKTKLERKARTTAKRNKK